MAATETQGPQLVPAHQGNRLAPGVFHPERSLDRFPVTAGGGHGQFAQQLVLGIDAADGHALHFIFPETEQLFPEPGNVLLPPGKAGEVLGEVKVQHRSADQHLFQFEPAIHPRATFQALLQGIRCHGKIPGTGMLGRGGQRRQQAQQQDSQDAPPHLGQD